MIAPDWDSLPGLAGTSGFHQRSVKRDARDDFLEYMQKAGINPEGAASVPPGELLRLLVHGEHGAGGKFSPARDDPKLPLTAMAINDPTWVDNERFRSIHDQRQVRKGVMDDMMSDYQDRYEHFQQPGWEGLAGLAYAPPDDQNAMTQQVIGLLNRYYRHVAEPNQFTPDELDRNMRINQHASAGKFGPASDDPALGMNPPRSPNELKIDHEMLQLWDGLRKAKQEMYRDEHNQGQVN